MRARLLVAAVGVPFILVVLTALPNAATAILVCLISLIAVYEMLSAAGASKRTATALLCSVSSAGIQIAVYFQIKLIYFAGGLFLLLVLLFVLWVAYYERGESFAFKQFNAALLAGVVIPLCFSSLIVLRNAENGVFKVLIPIGAAFVCDAGALFCGMCFGKHKLSPKTSPKKTLEGTIGGVVFSVLFMVLYAMVLCTVFNIIVGFPVMAALGVLCGILAQIGDLAFSLIKREFKIKDYGTVLPGHGGVLDRFDSMVTVAPAAALLFIIAAPF